jgi:hypothetical protein
MLEAYAAGSLRSAVVHTVLPVALSSAASPAPRPPGVTITRSPSTSGDSLISHCGFEAPNSLRMLRVHTTTPSPVRRQERSPSSDNANSRSPSMVGVPLGPPPLSWSSVRPSGWVHTTVPSARFRQKTTLLPSLVPCTKIRPPWMAIDP